MSYEIVPVDSFRKALQLRKLRNECRHFMTRDQSYIGILRQWRFWRHLRPTWKGYLIYREGVPVAFGVINGREITGGVAKKWRGQGIGRMMFEFLTNTVPKPGLLEVLADNKPALSLYESLGWEFANYSGYGILMMVRS